MKEKEKVNLHSKGICNTHTHTAYTTHYIIIVPIYNEKKENSYFNIIFSNFYFFSVFFLHFYIRRVVLLLLLPCWKMNELTAANTTQLKSRNKIHLFFYFYSNWFFCSLKLIYFWFFAELLSGGGGDMEWVKRARVKKCNEWNICIFETQNSHLILVECKARSVKAALLF